MVAYFILIIIHELIHGAFFKLFDPKGKVKFGFKNGVAYATSPHSFYSKGKFAIILLAPFLGISVGLFLLSACHLALFLGMPNNFLMEWWHGIYTYICIFKVEGLWMIVSSSRGDLPYIPSCSRVGVETLI